MTNRIRVLDHGIVELVESMGSDLSIVQAAQASFNSRSTEHGEREQGILRFLMREEHGVPFESVVLKYRMRMPVFLARQFVKHRVSSWSEQSARYDELEPLFYIPNEDDIRTQVGKVGAYTYIPVKDTTARVFRQDLREANHKAWSAYQAALDLGVAKEMARLSLPVNIYTNVMWTLNARSLFNVIHLRRDPHAQYEARQYAIALEKLAATVIPDTIQAFQENGRPNP